MAAKDLYEKDFYKVLGVDKKAAADEIKKRYRALARDLHPDKMHRKAVVISEISSEAETHRTFLLTYLAQLLVVVDHARVKIYKPKHQFLFASQYLEQHLIFA